MIGICRFFYLYKNNIAVCSLYEKAGGEKVNEVQDNDVTYFFNKFD